MGDDLTFALRLADAADAITVPLFRSRGLRVETKPDLTPVTQADRAVERALRELVAGERPGEVVLGEEEGGSTGATRWIVDPIDGTRNYSRGIPVWATLVALERDGEVEVGVVSAPALGRRWWAQRGGGAYANGEPIGVSRVARLEEACVCVPVELGLRELADRAWHPRGLGDFWAHMLVAEGAVDLTVESVGVSVWDLAAIQVIVEAAGGCFSDFAGKRRLDGGTAITSNGLLHEHGLRAVRGIRPEPAR